MLLCICCCASISMFSQEKVLLKGKIEADSLIDTAINIINLTQKTGTVNTASGSFEIEVAVSDSLWFSSVQYQHVKIKVTKEIFEKGFLEVYLEENVNELNEVQLTNVGLSGNLAKDLSTIKTFTAADVGFTMSDKPKLTSVERQLFTASGVQKKPQVTVSLDGMLNSFNGKIRLLTKAKENQDADNLVISGVNAMPIGFFTKDLHIPEEHIENFVYFCAENPNFETLLAPVKRLQLIEYYKKKAPEFLEERMGK